MEDGGNYGKAHRTLKGDKYTFNFDYFPIKADIEYLFDNTHFRDIRINFYGIWFLQMLEDGEFVEIGFYFEDTSESDSEFFVKLAPHWTHSYTSISVE